MRIITGIILDGFHKGHVVRMEYTPILKLLKPKIIITDYCCYGDEFPEDKEIIEYKECFMAADRDCVLYSKEGRSMDMLGWFNWEFSKNPWTEKTTLKMGFHDEPILRTDK